MKVEKWYKRKERSQRKKKRQDEGKGWVLGMQLRIRFKGKQKPVVDGCREKPRTARKRALANENRSISCITGRKLWIALDRADKIREDPQPRPILKCQGVLNVTAAGESYATEASREGYE